HDRDTMKRRDALWQQGSSEEQATKAAREAFDVKQAAEVAAKQAAKEAKVAKAKATKK
ncbi:unnamed protein product, partial [Adineta steineri]